MEEGTDQNENNHKQENESSELKSDNVNAAILSEELVESPSSLHDEETGVEEEGEEERNPMEPQDTPLPAGHPGAPEGEEAPTPEGEEAGEHTGDPEGAQQQEHDEDQNHDLDNTATRTMSPSLLVLDGASGLEAPHPSPPPGMLSPVDSVVTPGNPEERESSSSGKTPLEGTAAIDEEEEEEVKRGVDDDIEAYTQVYEQLCAERDQLTQSLTRWVLQTKLAENSEWSGVLWRRTEGDAQSEESGGFESHPQQQQQQQEEYERLLTHLGELKLEQKQLEVDAPKLESQEGLQQVESEWRELVALKRHTALGGGVGGARGRQQVCAVDQLLAREQERVDDLVALRLANATSTRREKKTKKKNNNGTQQTEPPAAGATIADGNPNNRSNRLKLWEQKKKQQAFIEKIDEDLLKIRKSITSTMEVTAHIEEDLQWIQAENQAKRAQLAHWEGLVAQKRDPLTDAKWQHNHLRSHALDLKQHCGMLGNVVLLRDFEDQTDMCKHLEGEASGLQRRHSETTLKCTCWRKKLERS